jgi:ABC-type polysaccharide/polyol phosphate export permease
LAIQFADVVEMYQILLTAWMYLTPIIYPLAIISAESRWLFNLNPLYHFLEIFRAPIQQGRFPEAGNLAVATTLAIVMLIVGWWSFVRSADELAYRV